MIWGILGLTLTVSGLLYAIHRSGVLNERLANAEAYLKDKQAREKHSRKIDDMVIDSLSALNKFLRNNRKRTTRGKPLQGDLPR